MRLIACFIIFTCLMACNEIKKVESVKVGLNADLTQVQMPQAPKIIPAPKSIKLLDGYFSLNAQTQLVASGDAVEIAQYAQSLFGPATGYQLIIVESKDTTNKISLILDASFTEPESYGLLVTSDAIEIRSASTVGLFWGVQSLRQLLPAEVELNAPVNRSEWPIASVDINDAPEFSYRGMHLDVSRTFFPVSFIKQYIDLLALHKLNYFHWHLTDDQGWRIEIKQYPRLTGVGAWRSGTVVGHTYDKNAIYDAKPRSGFYSQDDIREIVAYARVRQVTIIPEVDVPGHASAILQAYPEFACVNKSFEVQQNFGVFQEVLCPTEKTFAFLDAVFEEIIALFPSPYIHVGGDEVKTLQWENCTYCTALMEREGLKDYFALQGYFIRRVEESITKRGRKIIGWDEILEGGVAPSATITSWRGTEGAIHAAKLGHDAIMAPGSHLYFDHYQSRSINEPLAIHGLTPVSETYAFKVIPEELKGTPAEARILGAQGHLWTEYVTSPAKAEYMVLPRMSALAEVVWSQESARNWVDFSKRLPALIQRFSTMGLNVAKSAYAVNTQVTQENGQFKVQLSSDMSDVQIRYTLDGSMPNATSTVYAQPLTVSGQVILRAKAQDNSTGEMYLERRLSLNAHKALGAKVSLFSDADRAWNTQPELSLVDGVLARDQIFQLDDWATFPAKDFEAILEFEAPIEASAFNLGFNAGKFRDFIGPSALTLWASNNGKDWQPLASASGADIQTHSVSITLNFKPTSMHFLKVVVENKNMRYSTEDNKQVPVTLYFDELIVQ